MAAKVVMVAVPTVLGIASIRVYSGNEAAVDEKILREKLNVYAPLPGSAPAKFVPDSPGLIERGLTTTRESVLPLLHAVKGACVSVKKGSVHLYHTGEDAYYYLIDPPPGFLPRLGTITMAGLLGMFLARKGSRAKQLAVPVGLMSAGASVCYPAQAVAVLKVTGKKVYAAGQWSSAVVSSLFTSKEIVASQTPSATEPNPESAPAEESSSAQSSTVPPEEASSVTLTGTSPEQTPAQTSTETEVPPPSEGRVASDGGEEGSGDVSSEPTLSVEAPALEVDPVQPVEAESAPDGPAVSDTIQAKDDVSADPDPAEVTPSVEPETAEAVPAECVTCTPEASEQPPEPVAVSAETDPAAEPEPAEPGPAAEPEPAESGPAAEPEPAEPGPAAEPEPAESGPAAELEPAETGPAVEETPDPSVTPPPEHNSKEGSGFKPDPALMDFGQSSPEDEDLYSTRS